MRRFVLGALLLAIVGPAPVFSQPAAGEVVINEILYAPSESTNEFVELYNRSDTPVDLSQLSVADDNQNYSPVTSGETTLPPDGYAVLVRDPEAFEEAFPSVDHLTPASWPALNNGGDTVFLRHAPSGTVLDSVPYTPSWGGSDGRSLERIDAGGPSDLAHNFGASEADAGATPGTQNSLYDPDVSPPSLTAVTPSRDGETLTVSFSEPLDASTVTADAFRLATVGAPTVTEATLDDSMPQQVHLELGTSLSSDTYTLVATDVADRRGNALDEAEATFSYFDPARPDPGDIVISEIMYAPSVSSNEFIELYNASTKTFDLETLLYADENRDFDPIGPPFTRFEPDAYVVLVRDLDRFRASFPAVNAFAPSGWDALNNGGDTVLLTHGPTGTTLDSVPYTSSWGRADGQSLERIDPRAPSDAPSTFASSMAPAGGTPGAQNSRHAPDATPPTPVFAEQVEGTEGRVVFREPLDPESIRPEAFSLEGVTVTATSLQADSIVHLSLSEPLSSSSLTVSGVQDRVGNVIENAALPFAHQPAGGEIVINELLYDPRADDFDEQPNQVEYVELLNTTDRPLTLNGLLLTDRPTEEGVADTIEVRRSEGLLPEGFAVVAAAPSGARRVQDSQLAEAFPDIPVSSDSTRYLPVRASRLGLANGGDLVRLHRTDGTPIAEVSFDPNWHAPGLADPKGTALERISPTAAATKADNWTSSTAASGGTPGRPNSVAPSASEPPSEAPGLHIQPSPFSIERDGATRIQYTLSEAPSLVRAQIYDARGRKVRTLEDARLSGRTGELVWNGRDDAGNRVRIGVYVVLFEAVRADDGDVTQFKESVVFARPLQ